MSLDIALDPDTHDLLIRDNDLQIVNDADQLEQNLRIRLQFFIREWFLNINNGLPFYSDILVRNPNVSNIDSIIKAQIIDTNGVEEILAFISTFDAAERRYSITFKVRSEFGESELQVSLFNN